MHTISVIVPVYHGRQYLERMISQIEVGRQQLSSEYRIELILSNDAPDELIEVYHSNLIEIVSLNTDCNRGIHGARVEGLKHAKGDLILFLDQDDRVDYRYFSSQIKCMHDADAVVCRVIHGGKFHYTDTYPFEKVVTKEFMLNHWCSIISPGQVLIRREVIPYIWTKCILQNNGSDDYFLWLLMMAEGRKFVLNQEVLFEHVVHGANVSFNTNQMMDSEKEVVRLLVDSKAFGESDLCALAGLPDSLRRIHIKELDNYKAAHIVLKKVLEDFRNKKGILFERQFNSVAIYGAGDIGEAFYLGISNYYTGRAIYIDRNADYIRKSIPVYKLEDAPEDVEAIFIMVLTGQNEIKANLRQKYSCPVYVLEDILRHRS